MAGRTTHLQEKMINSLGALDNSMAVIYTGTQDPDS
jgi:hypothetical protein